MESHVYNERTATFETTISTCFCCNKRNASNSSKFIAQIFKENDRSNHIIYRSVSFGEIKIEIPRCLRCKVIQLLGNLITFLGGLTIAISIAVFIFLYFKDNGLMAIIGIFLIFFGIIKGGSFLKNIYHKIIGVDRIEKIVNNLPIVQEFLKHGWSTDTPRA